MLFYRFSKLLTTVLPVWGFVVSSCGTGGGDKEKNAAEFEEANRSLSQSVEEVVYNIPSPSEIPYMIQQTGAEFNPSLINPLSKAESYLPNSEKAALNLGIYAADIGYLVSYDKTQQSIDYVNACKKLADQLGVVESFDLEVLKRFEANISNKDSLTLLLDKSLKQTQRYLQDGRRSRLAALIVAGSFVEGLYISTGLVNTYPKNILPDDKRNLILTPLIQVILNQKKALADLIKMLEAANLTGTESNLLNDLRELEKTYQQLNVEEQIRANRGDLVLSDKNLTQISALVSKIRGEIVG
jgi:hypothetical protein